MSYRTLYRVWRPQTFSDVVGQEHVTRTLQNALKQQRFTHAYLFSGPRGTGKTSTAKIMAKAVNCESGPIDEPCNACPTCRKITEGSLMDVVEIDAASNRGVEEIRDLREKVKYAPTEARVKVYIIDEVHMLTPEAFNALLKTLEEPPDHVLFILATTEPYKLPLTIISRCQRFDFHRVSTEKMVSRLSRICREEGINVDRNALLLVAQVSEGGMRDALSLLDQAYAFGGERITESEIRAIVGTVSDAAFRQFFEFIAKKDAAGLLDAVSEWMREGQDPERLTQDLLQYLRDALLVRTAPGLSEARERLLTRESLREVSTWFTEARLFSMVEEINRTVQQMKWVSQPRILLELLVVKLTHITEQTVASEQRPPEHSILEPLVKRVEDLESRLNGLTQLSSETVAETTTPQVKRATRPKRPSSRGRTTSLERIEAVRKVADEDVLSNVKAEWDRVLNGVKEKKITVHAWLVDGEPVAATDGEVVLAFKNVIHRETTEKPANKQLIEEVAEQVFGRHCELLTCMQNEWKRLEATGGVTEQAATREMQRDDHVQKALDWFGEDLVEIVD